LGSYYPAGEKGPVIGMKKNLFVLAAFRLFILTASGLVKASANREV
jgi:hypothetical protein